MRYVHTKETLLAVAIRRLRSWSLLLQFQATSDEEEDCSRISQALPWFWRLSRRERDFFTMEGLRRDRFALLVCDGPEEAFQLAGDVHGFHVTAHVFDPEGHKIPLQTGPEIRKARGVFATPRPLARWIVRSVDVLLRTALERPEGLADNGLRLLDPAAGNMNFVMEAYRHAIARHRLKQGKEDLEALVHGHLLPHFQGFEIVPATWAAGHIRVRRWLEKIGMGPGARQQALPLFLADALAGPGSGGTGFLAREAEAAASIKAAESLTVILGNPPFNGRPSVASPWITRLLHGYELPGGQSVEGYFSVAGRSLGERNVKWLHDDYVKFLRFAQWRIDRAGEGIVAFVVNHNGLEAPTFRGLRHSLLGTFERIYALDLHGNHRRKEKGPAGEREQNVFEGVAQGIAILLLVKKPGLSRGVFRGDLYGSRQKKLAILSRTHVGTFPWQEIQPRPPMYLFRGTDAHREREFRQGVSLTEIFPLHSLGVVTGRDEEVIALDRETLEEKLPGGRRRLVTSFLARPFDLRHLLFDDRALARPRKAVMEQLRRGGNLGLLALRQGGQEPGAFVTRWVTGHKVVSPYAPNTIFPLYVLQEGRAVPNLDPRLCSRLADHLGAEVDPEDLLGYMYALLHDSRFLARFRELMRSDFPRVPLPEDLQQFRRLADLGRELISAHLLEHPRLTAPKVRLSGDSRSPLSLHRSVLGSYEEADGRLRLNPSGLCFEGIEPELWHYQIGGYPVLKHWLRARAGRVLRSSEAREFRRIAAALRVSLDLLIQIENV